MVRSCSGPAHVPWYDGANLARRDAVIVTINYRLGAFGYLHLEGLDPAYAGRATPGCSTRSPRSAWVRDNIAAFGGDPDNVTVWGESAGAMSVGALLGTPAAEGLFRRAILQSGAASNVHGAESATRVAAQVVDAAGGIDRLRTMSAAELLAVQEDVVDPSAGDGSGVPAGGRRHGPARAAAGPDPGGRAAASTC